MRATDHGGCRRPVGLTPRVDGRTSAFHYLLLTFLIHVDFLLRAHSLLLSCTQGRALLGVSRIRHRQLRFGSELNNVHEIA